MKKKLTISVVIMSLVLIISACTYQVIDEEPTPASSMDESLEIEEKDMENDEATMEQEMMDGEGDAMDEEMMMSNDGDMAPTFSLMSLQGDEINLESYKGKKVYLKFWASWCSICLSGMPELEALAMSDEEFVVLTIVSPGHSGEKSTEDFKTWYEKNGSENITVLLDESGELMREYRVIGYPTSAYIGSDGVLVKTQPGHQDNENIRESFDDIY